MWSWMVSVPEAACRKPVEKGFVSVTLFCHRGFESSIQRPQNVSQNRIQGLLNKNSWGDLKLLAVAKVVWFETKVQSCGFDQNMVVGAQSRLVAAVGFCLSTLRTFGPSSLYSWDLKFILGNRIGPTISTSRFSQHCGINGCRGAETRATQSSSTSEC